MFSKTNKTDLVESASINLIGTGTQITGDVVSPGDVRIDGVLSGNININGKLVVGPTGKVEGNIQCQNADISGEVKGKLNITDLLFLKATAKVNGEVITGKLAIEPNALFSGTCTMNNTPAENSLAMPENPKNKPPEKPYNAYLKYSGLAIQMGAIIGLGAWGGHALDAHYQTRKPIFTITLSLVAIAIALYLVLRDFIKPKSD